jgi:Ras-related protein Rab-6A
MADGLKIGFIETSAKAGINIRALFKNLATDLPGIDLNGNDVRVSTDI